MDHICNMNERENRNRLSLFSPGQNLQALQQRKLVFLVLLALSLPTQMGFQSSGKSKGKTTPLSNFTVEIPSHETLKQLPKISPTPPHVLKEWNIFFSCLICCYLELICSLPGYSFSGHCYCCYTAEVLNFLLQLFSL